MKKRLALVAVVILATSGLMAGEVVAPAGEETVGATGIIDGPEPSLCWKNEYGELRCIIDGPDPVTRQEVTMQPPSLVTAIGDEVVTEIPPPVSVIDEVPIGVDACYDNIAECRTLVSDRCGAHGGVTSVQRRQARLAVCQDGGETRVCCTGTCQDGTTIECKAAR
jgi:hypothetical protein